MTNELKQIVKQLQSIDSKLKLQNAYWAEWKVNKDACLAKEEQQEEERKHRNTETDAMISGFMNMLRQVLVQKGGTGMTSPPPAPPPPPSRPFFSKGLQHTFRGNQWITDKRRSRGKSRRRRSRRKS